MEVNLTDCFENPEIPDWLHYALMVSFRQKNIDNIVGYQKLLEGIIYG